MTMADSHNAFQRLRLKYPRPFGGEIDMTPENCKQCIKYLLDKSEDGHTRVAAAESLMHCNTDEAKQALFRIVADESEPDYLREEAAVSLGARWGESEIDYDRLVQIPSRLLDEVVCDFDSYRMKIDKGRLCDKLTFFEQRYGERQFMAE